MKRKPKSAPRRPRVRRGNEDDAQQFKDELLKAAMQLFAEGGIEAVSVRAIAQAVGVSPMTPYRYFADKAELLSGLWQFSLEALRADLLAAMATQPDARARQRAFFDAYLAYWETHPDSFWLVQLTQGATKPRAANADPAQSHVYADLLALMRSTTQALAAEIGADMTWAKLSEDLTFAMLLGYLQSEFVNQRYPWTDRQLLRAAYLDQLLACKERALLQGPAVAAAKTPRAALRRGVR